MNIGDEFTSFQVCKSISCKYNYGDLCYKDMKNKFICNDEVDNARGHRREVIKLGESTRDNNQPKLTEYILAIEKAIDISKPARQSVKSHEELMKMAKTIEETLKKRKISNTNHPKRSDLVKAKDITVNKIKEVDESGFKIWQDTFTDMVVGQERRITQLEVDFSIGVKHLGKISNQLSDAQAKIYNLEKAQNHNQVLSDIERMRRGY